MKNFIFKSSPDSDFTKIISLLEVIQKEQRANRYDNQIEIKQLDKCVKALALMVSAPEADDMTEHTIEEYGKKLTVEDSD